MMLAPVVYLDLGRPGTPAPFAGRIGPAAQTFLHGCGRVSRPQRGRTCRPGTRSPDVQRLGTGALLKAGTDTNPSGSLPGRGHATTKPAFHGERLVGNVEAHSEGSRY